MSGQRKAQGGTVKAQGKTRANPQPRADVLKPVSQMTQRIAQLEETLELERAYATRAQASERMYRRAYMTLQMRAPRFRLLQLAERLVRSVVKPLEKLSVYLWRKKLTLLSMPAIEPTAQVPTPGECEKASVPEGCAAGSNKDQQ